MEDQNPKAERDPILERKSHVFGHVQLYAPRGNPDSWHKLPWIVVTTKGGDDNAPIKVRVKAEFAYAAWDRPSFIADNMRYYE